ncbi:MAG: sigma-70 family RNA polymerase sigma factor [Phaeodactylibacter sp.]|nr:sigma-70 family RNA polymerase sigma factor [Phaeodactylibacter sp.]MCB0613893.1 sigma-70 family RNA polymerase sigma factor [Phaeodactylibacter sp.]MCB9301857.1 sigma-70 family RNA polymerase sigma factor [Lewinellaceae bacterium]
MEVAVQTTITSQRALDDYSIVKKAIQGDQKAYAILMDRYRNPIYHMMLKMVNNNRDDADDLTIEAFGKAFSKLSSYVPRYAFSTWLFRIAINNGIDYIRKKRLNLYSIDEPIDGESSSDYSSHLKASTLNPEEEIIRTQRIQLMRQLLSQLNGKYRLMIELRYFEELSYEEIAEELDIPLGTVKAQLFRAKEMLANMLTQPGASAYVEVYRRA